MSLISTLNEAADTKLQDLKSVVTKDKRIKMILSKTLSLEDIKNPKEFIDTLRFQVLNNRNVIDFVNERDGVFKTSKTMFAAARKLTANQLTDEKLKQLQITIQGLFKEIDQVQKGGVSTYARREILDWINSSGRYYDLSRGTQRELASTPSLKPDGPIVLYRGLLFNSYDLVERERYDGTLEVGKGLKFLRSIRKGKRIVDLEWDRPSSWSKHLAIAERFAKYGPASSSYAATMQWLTRGKKEIDGDLGFVVSTLIQPDDVLIDISKFQSTAHRQHGDEGEIIIKPGTYRCRLHTKFDKSGKVDLDSASEDQLDGKAEELVNQVRVFAKTWKADWSAVHSDDWHFYDFSSALLKLSEGGLKALFSAATTEKVISQYDQLREFYSRLKENFGDEVIQRVLLSPETSQLGNWIKNLYDELGLSVTSKKYVTDKNPKGKMLKGEINGQDYRNSLTSSEAMDFKNTLKSARFTDYRTGMLIGKILKKFANRNVSEIHRKKGADQKALVEEAAAALLDFFNTDQGEKSKVEAAATVILRVDRNLRMTQFLNRTRKSLSKVVS